MITEERVYTILHLAQLHEGQEMEFNEEVVVEALKCICNMVYQCKTAARVCAQNACVKTIVNRIKHGNDVESVWQLDMRILFLITALHQETRAYLRNDLSGFDILASVLDKATANVSEASKEFLMLPELALKVMFNITLNDDDDECKYSKLVDILRKLLLLSTKSECQNDVVNLLINVPSSCLKNLAPDGTIGEVEFEYEHKDVKAIHELLKYLKHKLDKVSLHN